MRVVQQSGRAPVDRHDERPRARKGARQPRNVVEPQLAEPARGDDAVDRANAETRHSQQRLAIGAIDVDRELLAVFERPGELGIDVETGASRMARPRRDRAG